MSPHRFAQAANVQIMLSLLIAMALKTDLPHPDDPESKIFGMLTVVFHLACDSVHCASHTRSN